MTTILKGNIVSAPSLGRLDVTENGYLIAENGVITGVYPVLPEQYAGAAVEDCGDALIVQSFADLHLHAPQYPMLGMGMDLPLLDWLNAYAFPTEARFADPAGLRLCAVPEAAEAGTLRLESGGFCHPAGRGAAGSVGSEAVAAHRPDFNTEQKKAEPSVFRKIPCTSGRRKKAKRCALHSASSGWSGYYR